MPTSHKASVRDVEISDLTVGPRSDEKSARDIRQLSEGDFIDAVKRSRKSGKSEDAALRQIHGMFKSFFAPSKQLHNFPMANLVLAALQNGTREISSRQSTYLHRDSNPRPLLALSL